MVVRHYYIRSNQYLYSFLKNSNRRNKNNLILQWNAIQILCISNILWMWGNYLKTLVWSKHIIDYLNILWWYKCLVFLYKKLKELPRLLWCGYMPLRTMLKHFCHGHIPHKLFKTCNILFYRNTRTKVDCVLGYVRVTRP